MISIEEQIDWFARLIGTMDARGLLAIEADATAESEWVAHVNERARETLYMTTNSYYNGAEVSGKPRVFMPYSGGVRGYRRILEACAAEGYPGFTFVARPQEAVASARAAAPVR
jgi:cyclohexanone monooxygenase